MSVPSTLQLVQMVIEISRKAFAAYAERHPGDHPEPYFTNDLEINPYHRQTQFGGIFLEFANGATAFLWKEYGQIYICSGVHGNPKQIREVSSQLLRQLSVRPYQDGAMEVAGYFLGPMFEICRVGDTLLPKAQERSQENILSPSECRSAWEKMLLAA